eukprot:6181744-Pleurochrysis_carterae.AAC.5
MDSTRRTCEARVRLSPHLLRFMKFGSSAGAAVGGVGLQSLLRADGAVDAQPHSDARRARHRGMQCLTNLGSRE